MTRRLVVLAEFTDDTPDEWRAELETACAVQFGCEYEVDIEDVPAGQWGSWVAGHYGKMVETREQADAVQEGWRPVITEQKLMWFAQ